MIESTEFELRRGGARPRVVVVGGGFAGLQVVRGLRRAPVDVTLVDRQNYLAVPAARLPGRDRGAVGRPRSPRRCAASSSGSATPASCWPRRPGSTSSGAGSSSAGWRTACRPSALGYDTLVVAGGSQYSYFGHPEWAEHAPQLKSLDGALDIRTRILAAFEAAEVEPDPDRRRAWLTFVVVGAGPTGVEMAGQIAELARDTLRRDFRSADTRAARVLLVEAGEPRAGAVPGVAVGAGAARAGEARRHAAGRPHRRRRRRASRWRSAAADGAVEQVAARTAIWAAGVTASPLAAMLADAAGAAVDRAGRVTVGPDLTLAGHPEVLALGDMVAVRDGEGAVAPLPGLAPVAMQQGRYAARLIRDRLRGRATPPLPLPRQGQPRHDRPLAGRRRRQGRAPVRLRRLGAVAGRPPRLPDRLPEPAARPAALVDQLPHPRPRRPPDRRVGADGAVAAAADAARRVSNTTDRAILRLR